MVRFALSNKGGKAIYLDGLRLVFVPAAAYSGTVWC